MQGIKKIFFDQSICYLDAISNLHSFKEVNAFCKTSRDFFRVHELLSEIERVLQSCEKFDWRLKWSMSNCPLEKVTKRNVTLILKSHWKKTTSLIKIINREHLCCARAIVTAKARIDKHPKWNSIRKGNIILKGDVMHHISYLMCFDMSIWLFTCS